MEAPGTRPWVAVVGGVNLDICGKSDAHLIRRDSNPGTVRFSLGGVGRNIAHNMALLGLDVKLFTALGTDENAERVERSCRELGIDLTHSLRLEGEATSTYLVITDHRGEMALAVSDMDVVDRLTPDYIEPWLDTLNQAGLVVVDTNLPAEALAWLANRCTAPIFADPVSTAKAPKLEPVLDRLHTLKANRMEAGLLSGMDVVGEVSLYQAAQRLLDKGPQRVIITMGAAGALCATQTGEKVYLPPISGPKANATGCGDAFMAALAWSFLEGLDQTESLRMGLAASAIALAGEETINPGLSVSEMKRIAEG